MRKLIHITTGGVMLFAGALFAMNANADVRVVTGGVGESSQMFMESLAKQHNLKLVFTGDRGMYLANVDVAITDSTGNTVVRTVTDGPMLLTDLPAGRYTVSANAEGFSKQQQVQVGKGLKSYTLNFPIKDDVVYSMDNRTNTRTDTRW